MVTGQSEKEKKFMEKIMKKNRNRTKLPRTYQQSKIKEKE